MRPVGTSFDRVLSPKVMWEWFPIRHYPVDIEDTIYHKTSQGTQAIVARIRWSKTMYGLGELEDLVPHVVFFEGRV